MTRHHTCRRLPTLFAMVAVGLLAGAAAAQNLTQDNQVQDTNRLVDRKGEFGRFEGRGVKVPPLEVRDDGLNLGNIRPETEHVRTVMLCNTGLKELVIERTTADCACTALEPETRVIPPGECIPFTVRYKANQNVAPIRKEVRVFCEGYPNPFVAQVTGEVTYGVKLNKDGLRGILETSGVVTLHAIDDRPFTVTAVNGEPPTYVGFDPEADAPRTSYVISYDWNSMPARDLPRWMIIETDHPEALMMDLRVIIPEVQDHNLLIQQTDKFRPIEERLLLTELSPGEGREISVTVKGVGRGTVDAVGFKVESDALDVEFVDRDSEPKSGSMVYRLLVTPRPGATGFEHAVLRVTMGEQTSGLDLFARLLDTDAVSRK